MIYPIKTLSQLPLILKGLRKEKGLTQAAIAERLGITQQSYAYFEANPAASTLERLFLVLRMLGVEISLDQTLPATDRGAMPSVTAKAIDRKIGESPGTTAKQKVKPSAVARASRVVASTKRKESW